MRRQSLIASIFTLVCTCITLNIFALDVPKSSNFDSHIQYVNYNEANVVEVNARAGISTLIVFESGEEIISIGSGFTAGWQFQPRQNYLFLMPKSIKDKNGTIQPITGKWDTDFQVTTNFRVYTFQLKLQADSDENDNIKVNSNQNVAYLIVFKYPQEEARKAKLAAEKGLAEKRLNQESCSCSWGYSATNGKNLSGEDSCNCNWNYSMALGKGSTGIAPSMAYDDARFTYLRFPGNREFPAVFVVSEDGSESLVNSHIDPKKPDTLVVQRVAPQMVLRLGSEVVGIFNENYNPIGIATNNGTTVPGVKRTIRINDGDNHP